MRQNNIIIQQDKGNIIKKPTTLDPFHPILFFALNYPQHFHPHLCQSRRDDCKLQMCHFFLQICTPSFLWLTHCDHTSYKGWHRFLLVNVDQASSTDRVLCTIRQQTISYLMKFFKKPKLR